MQELNEQQNAVIGALAGAIEVTVNQPTVTWKNAVQQGKPITLNPAVAYRGYLSNVLNMGTATMVQFAVSGTMKNVFTNGGQTPLSAGQEVLSALIAGTVSGVFCNPLELTMITQQNNGGGFFGTMVGLAKRSPAALFRGTTMTCAREGVYTAGYLGVTPVVTRYLYENHRDGIFANEVVSRCFGALAGATVGAFASHPADTVKTLMQSDMERTKWGSPRQTFSQLVKTSGPTALYRGAPWRFGRQVIGVFLLDQARSSLSPMIFPDAFGKGAVEAESQE